MIRISIDLEFDPWMMALFGLIVGSFLNVCIYRLPRDFSVSYPRRSFCPSCGRKIAWYDNIPLVSYFILGGRCRYCRTRISLRYPVVEALTGAAFFSAGWQYGTSWDALRLMVFSSLLIVLFFSDLETRILPNEITLGGAFAGWMLALLAPIPVGVISLLLPKDATSAGQSLVASLLGGLLPAIGLWTIGELYLRWRGREGLGFGDVKMMLLLGAFLGLENTILTIIVGSVAGSLLGIVLLALKGKEAAKYELPFGSFLAAAGLIVAHLAAILKLSL